MDQDWDMIDSLFSGGLSWMDIIFEPTVDDPKIDAHKIILNSINRWIRKSLVSVSTSAQEFLNSTVSLATADSLGLQESILTSNQQSNDAGGESNFARLHHDLVPEGIEEQPNDAGGESNFARLHHNLGLNNAGGESNFARLPHKLVPEGIEVNARESVLEQQINQSLERETLGVCVYISSRFLSSNQTNASSNRTSYCNDQNLR